MELERIFFERLGAVSGYFLKGNVLRLSDDEGVAMVFERPTDS
jgi:hypothetical protein